MIMDKVKVLVPIEDNVYSILKEVSEDKNIEIPTLVSVILDVWAIQQERINNRGKKLDSQSIW